MNVMGTLNLLLTYAFDFYITIVIARFMLQMVRADFYNPLSQFVVKATKPLLTPLRRIVPGFGGIDAASLVLLLLLVCIKIGILFGLHETPFDPIYFGVIILKSLANSVLNFFLLTIFGGAILSWVAQGYNPVVYVIMQVSDPVLKPFRKLLPNMGGIDFSPMLALLALQAIKTLFQLEGTP